MENVLTTADSRSITRRMRPELQALTGLRFLAAFFVVIYHYAQPILSGSPNAVKNIGAAGYTAVGLFFLLSGFVLSYRYIDKDGHFLASPQSFWRARLARIYPAYLAGFALAAPFVIEASLRVNPLPVAAAKLGLNGVLALFLQQSWTPWTAWYWNTPGWSLSTEVFFYFGFPFLAPMASRLGYRQILPAIGLLWTVALFGPILLSCFRPVSAQPPMRPLQLAIEVMPLFRLPEFLIGVLLGRLYVLRGVRHGMENWMAAAGMGAVLFSLAISPAIPRPLLSNGILIPAAGLVLLTLASGRGFASFILSRQLFVRLGEASYSIYILQLPVAHAFGIPSGTASVALFTAYAATLTGLSFFCLYWIEMPARKAVLNRFGRTGVRNIQSCDQAQTHAPQITAQHAG